MVYMTGKHVYTKRGKVYYCINRVEDAPCIVFTHGLTADLSMFEKQAEYFAGKYTVILWDVPLHGRSKEYSDFSYRNTARDLRRILDSEEVERALLVGMSMGGYPSQMFAAAYPERTAGFVGIDTTPFGEKYYSRSDVFWLERVADISSKIPERTLKSSMAKNVSNTEYSRLAMENIYKGETKDEIIRQMDAAYGQFIRENRDLDIRCPGLLLVGDRDRTGKVAEYNKKWEKESGWPLHIVPNAAHFSNGDNPDFVNAEIEAFAETVFTKVKSEE